MCAARQVNQTRMSLYSDIMLNVDMLQTCHVAFTIPPCLWRASCEYCSA